MARVRDHLSRSPAELVPATPTPLWLLAIHAALWVLTVLPFLVTRFPPLYDYYYWLYEGNVVAHLLPWGPSAADALPYHLTPLPVPNLAAPLGIGLLGTWLAAPTAARVFAAGCVLSVGAGFAYLVRSLHRRPSAVEFMGFPLAFGYLTYKGYLSNACALGLALFAMGSLQRVVDRGRRLGWGVSALFGGVGVVLYLCHLLGWAPFAVAIGLHTLGLAVRGRKRCAVRLAASLAPSLALLAVYVARQPAGAGAAFYGSILNKAVSLVSPLMLFMRTDPFPSPFPILWANVLGWVGLLAIVVVNRDRGTRGSAGPLVLAVPVLLAVAIASPLKDIGGANRPEERLVIVALLLGLATVRSVPLTRARALAAASIAVCLLGLHAIEFASAGRRLAQVKTVLDRSVPLDGRSLGLTLWSSRAGGGCGGERQASFGVPTLKWFDLQRYVDSDAARVLLTETSFVRYDPGFDHPVDHVTMLQSLDRVQRYPGVRAQIEEFPVLEILACREDARALRRELRRDYDSAEETEWVTVLRGPPQKNPWEDVLRRLADR